LGLAPLVLLDTGLEPSRATLRDAWSFHRIPPPTDLVIAFQHFVI
jgi:hypothetical protein